MIFCSVHPRWKAADCSRMFVESRLTKTDDQSKTQMVEPLTWEQKAVSASDGPTVVGRAASGPISRYHCRTVGAVPKFSGLRVKSVA